MLLSTHEIIGWLVRINIYINLKVGLSLLTVVSSLRVIKCVRTICLYLSRKMTGLKL